MSQPRVGVVVLHGIGTQTAEFADDFLARLLAKLNSRECGSGGFAFEPVFWADTLAGDEAELMRNLGSSNRLDWRPLREFVVHTLADAVAYRRGYPKEWDAYHAVHWRVHRALQRLRSQLLRHDDLLVMIGHSLGSVILSDHVWDEQKGEGFGDDCLTRCETLAGIITMGSNIPLFTLGLPRISCINFPGGSVRLPADVKHEARWFNFYDRDDVLGYPLRPLSESYAAAVQRDVELNAGGPLTSWTPLSHNGYFTDSRIIGETADLLERLLFVHAQDAT